MPWHHTWFTYADDFSDASKNGGKLAYVTKVKDADGFEASARYNYDTGAETYTRTPSGGTGNNITHEELSLLYDPSCRPEHRKMSSYLRVEDNEMMPVLPHWGRDSLCWGDPSCQNVAGLEAEVIVTGTFESDHHAANALPDARNYRLTINSLLQLTLPSHRAAPPR